MTTPASLLKDHSQQSDIVINPCSPTSDSLSTILLHFCTYSLSPSPNATLCFLLTLPPTASGVLFQPWPPGRSPCPGLLHVLAVLLCSRCSTAQPPHTGDPYGLDWPLSVPSPGAVPPSSSSVNTKPPPFGAVGPRPPQRFLESPCGPLTGSSLSSPLNQPLRVSLSQLVEPGSQVANPGVISDLPPHSCSPTHSPAAQHQALSSLFLKQTLNPPQACPPPAWLLPHPLSSQHKPTGSWCSRLQTHWLPPSAPRRKTQTL